MVYLSSLAVLSALTFKLRHHLTPIIGQECGQSY